ncbi:unnamed protein product [Heligmosomoides polygyrus]|uniref:Secreted protein n=1 Tax=Heligmosomoides polygyrus TaxID=6339 RepID=A0A183G7A9_HELPZ|nr:unnamed protein product [Heligmosomoides polygyrus]
MVELGSRSPFGQSFDNSVFIVPAIVILFIVGQCLLCSSSCGLLSLSFAFAVMHEVPVFPLPLQFRWFQSAFLVEHIGAYRMFPPFTV